MSTTRHLINRRRRLAALSAAPGARTVRGDRPAAGASRAAVPARARSPRATAAPGAAGSGAPPEPVASGPARRWRPAAYLTPAAVAVAVLALLTVLLGGFAAWAAGRASDLRGSLADRNTALTDNTRTSEVKGSVSQAVDAVFSYDYADTARTDKAAAKVLTGRAVRQYASMIARVKAQAAARKTVLTTTVTDAGVEMIDGDRARLLLYADQRNTGTAKGSAGDTAYAAAMFAVDAVEQDGTWKIASIDTFS
ncbi:hypothetical protein [Streptomyces sp. HPF1205]|uniref:hypothetical protein n=1 Tax=Streptomyces sp. HPF1205 TaxID=2873262 RepID=UPI001CECA25A|nr:hypothetical protein [Streptomyces sp. HPF1205]